MTLIEAIVWISIFTVAMFAIVSSVMQFYKTNRFAIDQASAIASAQRGIDRMVRIIREASYSTQGAYPIVSMATSSFTFYSDMDNDGFAERVRYSLVGEDLTQGVIAPVVGSSTPYSGAEVVSTTSPYVRNGTSTPLFQYYNASGALMSDYTDIDGLRFVVVTMITDVDPLLSPTLLTFRSSAALRNLIGQ